MAVRPTPLIPPPATELPLGEGRTLRIGSQLGRGDAATVYRGRIEGRFGVRRDVAVKVFDVIASDEHDAVLATLAGSFRRAACIRHPNVARVEDFGILAPAQPYAVLELVEGRSLARLESHVARRRERLPLDVALFIGLEVAEGLAGARVACSPEGVRLGVVHEDLASSDVLLSWHGEVKVCDFGLGATSHVASGVRSTRGAAGRLRAVAPEVARGQRGDARSDVFSLGVLLHEMLVGPRFPEFVSEAQALTLARDGIVHRSLFEPQPPPLVRAILGRALERDPDQRYPHAGALAFELRRAALTMGVGDGRAYLRAALARAFGEDGSLDEEATGEVRVPRLVGAGRAGSDDAPRAVSARPSRERSDARETVDRFARLRGDAPEDAGFDVDADAGDDEAPGPAGLQSGTRLVGGIVGEDDVGEDDVGEDDVEEA